jgi:hypothetical protein
MTAQEFAQKESDEQQQTIARHGVKLGERVQPDFKYELYQVANFYIELKMDALSNDVVGFQTFDTVDELEPYLQLMNIKTDGLNK